VRLGNAVANQSEVVVLWIDLRLSGGDETDEQNEGAQGNVKRSRRVPH
jgi:hypothetical protein